MTPTEFRKIREAAGLSVDQLASVLRLASGRSVRRYEDGSREISGPIARLMELLDAGTIGRE